VPGNDVYFQKVTLDSSGNTYIVGTTVLAGGYKNLQLSKYNTSGTLQWQQQLGTSSTISQGSGIALDGAGNIYICGFTDASNSANKYDILIAKFNSSGSVQWSRRLTSGPETSSTVIAYGSSIAIDSSDNIYICGNEQTSPTAIRYGVIVRYNTSGTVQWQRTITGSADIKINSIEVDSNSTLYVTGSIAPGSVQSNGGSWLLLKLPSDGSLTGTYTASGTSIVYSASSLNSWTGSLTSSASSLVDSTSAGNASVTTLTASTPTYSITSTTI
jgi:hypothetical protein